MEQASPHLPGTRPGWRRLVAGIVLRSLGTVVRYALGALALFLVALLVLERWLLPDSSALLAGLAVPYVLIGALAGVNLGVTAALRRESAALAAQSGWLVGPVIERALDRLAIPEDGIATARLRELAELRGLVSPGGGPLERFLAWAAIQRTLREAGMRAFCERVLEVVETAEAHGEEVIGREALETAVRNGLGELVAQQLDVGWRANRLGALALGGLALAWLPTLAIILG
jgi:hypothetical protein